MKYNIIFTSGRKMNNMTPAEFYTFFHSYHGLNYTVYDQKGTIVGPFDNKGQFVGA